MLKQTVGEFNDGLFLWNGSLVDLKDFKNTVRDGADEMTIGFTINQLSVRSRTSDKIELINNVRIEISLSEQADDKHYDYIKRMSIAFDKHSLLLEYISKDYLRFSVDDIKCISV